MGLDHVSNNRWCVLVDGHVPEAGWTPIPRDGAGPAAVTPSAHRDRLYGAGLCRSCELPLLPEELAADATSCGVCRAVRARAKAMKRTPEKTPQEVNAYYAERIAAEQAKRTAAGLAPGGRTLRDREHARRKARR